jgi:hypothetical protein
MNQKELHWLAGLLEGEGSFTLEHRSRRKHLPPKVRVSVATTDKDVAEKVASILGQKVQGPYDYTKPNGHLGNKQTYRVQEQSVPKAIGLMFTLYPLMSKRRQNRIEKVVKEWKNAPSGN